MEREILFRGKLSHSGEWITGSLIIARDDDYYIIPTDIFETDGHHLIIDADRPFKVLPETIGQFTGLADKNGERIFDGDVLLSKSWGVNSRNKRKTHIVKWGKGGWITSGYNGGIVVTPQLDVKSDWEVIGNIHDNPELLLKK